MYEGLEPIMMGILGDTHFTQWLKQQGPNITPPALLNLISPGDTVVDVGAYIGAYTWEMIRKTGPSGLVYAFEPNPQAFKCLKYNCPEAVCYEYALANCDGYCGFNINPNNPSASFCEQTNSNLIQAKHLDGFNIAPDVIKIDVEGFELFVLIGGKKTIDQYHPKMYIEVSPNYLLRHDLYVENIELWLKERSYNVTKIGDPVQQDWVCI